MGVESGDNQQPVEGLTPPPAPFYPDVQPVTGERGGGSLLDDLGFVALEQGTTPPWMAAAEELDLDWDRSPSPDSPPPVEPGDGTSGESEPPAAPSLDLITRITLPRGKSDEAVDKARHPKPGAINLALRNGDALELSLFRPGPSQSMEVHASRAFVAHGATVRDEPTRAGTATATLLPESKPQAWARIRPVLIAPSEQDETTKPSGSQGVQMAAVAECEVAAPFEVRISARAVDTEDHRKLVRDLKIAASNAGEIGADEEKARLGALHAELNTARAAGSAEMEVVVGTSDPKALAEVAEHVAQTFLPTDRVRWEVITDPTTREVVDFKSREAAIADGKADPHSYLSAERLGKLIEYPDAPISGLPVEEGYTFAAER